MKRALISGITGQDSTYFAEFLLAKDYEVHGIKRRASSFNAACIDQLYKDLHDRIRRFLLHYGTLISASGRNAQIHLCAGVSGAHPSFASHSGQLRA